jgi:hypothetical protein
MSEPSWELLGGGGVIGGPINYVGAWAAGTTYQPGQVVRYNGIDYLAVTPSVGQVPPGAVSALLPQPIVNGRWVKGVGGAAVWSPIVATDVPGLVTADTGWITMSLNSGSHYAAPWGPCQYRKLASGLVVCQGLFTVTVTSATAWIAPVGYRPLSSRNIIFQTASSVSPTPPETWRLNGDGTLVPQASLTPGSWISMCGVVYWPEG